MSIERELKEGDKIEIYVYEKWRKAVVKEEDGKLWAVGSDMIGNTKGFKIWLEGFLGLFPETDIRLTSN